MSSFNRRQFLGATAASAATCVMPRFAIARRRRSDDLSVAVIGFNGRGRDLLGSFRGVEGVTITALCDADQAVLDREVARSKERGETVFATTDLRRVLDRDDVDVVVTATPNHWHSLITVWACQAGKDVYVEKPVSHNIFEGGQMVKAARKYGRIVQTGTQTRSSHGIAEAVAWVQGGGLGRIKLARGLCYKPRTSIGKVEGPVDPPATVDYDLWTGPAPLKALGRSRLHYDWHWVFDTGNGDLGNQGIHQMDICRWFLGERGLAPRVIAAGGRFGYDDDGNTPNTMVVVHGYEAAPLVFEVRGLPRDRAAQTSGGWGGAMDDLSGIRIGCIIECEGGRVHVPDYSRAIVYDKDGAEVRRFEGAKNHQQNFVDAVRSRRVEDLNADIREGHVSSALCHAGNISYLLGERADRAAADAAVGEVATDDGLQRMCEHLGRNEVDVDAAGLTVGRSLRIDPERECFMDDSDADRLLTREYRAPFVVPVEV